MFIKVNFHYINSSISTRIKKFIQIIQSNFIRLYVFYYTQLNKLKQVIL